MNAIRADQATGRWEHFAHVADLGVRGYGSSVAEAFAAAATALTAAVTDPDKVAPDIEIGLRCSAPDLELLLAEWLNALVYEMATRRMLFSHFEVEIEAGKLNARVSGEAIDLQRHQPAVEIKGATYTELAVYREADNWVAQCVVDV